MGEVADAITHLRTIGALEQSVSDWGYSKSGDHSHNG